MTYDNWKATDPADWQEWPPMLTCYCGHDVSEHDGHCTVDGCACCHFECEYEEDN